MNPSHRCWPKTAADLEQLGAAIAPHLKVADAVCLSGPLGAGKTTLARGLIRRLTSLEEDVPSPTFTLVQTYSAQGLTLSHFDLYRLNDPEDVFETGLDDALETGAVIIEWPERLGGRLPPDRLDVRIEFLVDGSDAGRRVELAGTGRWAARVQALGLDPAEAGR